MRRRWPVPLVQDDFMSAQQLVMLALQVSIVFVVLGFGLAATKADLLYLVRQPGLLLRSVVATLVLMPVAAIVIRQLFDLQSPVGIALLALAISPVPPLLPQKPGKLAGRQPYALALMATLAAFAVVSVPVALNLLGRYYDRDVAIAPAVIARIVVVAVFAPLLAGLLLRTRAPALADRLQRPVARTALVLLGLGALALLAGSWRAVWASIGDGSVLAIIAFVLAGLIIGHVMGGPAPAHAVVLALSSACRHPVIALTVATTNFPDQRFIGAILLYLLVSTALTAAYLAWLRRRFAATTSAPAA